MQYKQRIRSANGRLYRAPKALIIAIQAHLSTLEPVPSRSGRVPSRSMIEKVLIGQATARYISEAACVAREQLGIPVPESHKEMAA